MSVSPVHARAAMRGHRLANQQQAHFVRLNPKHITYISSHRRDAI